MTNLTRNITLGLGAAAIAVTMTLAGAAQAKPKVNFYLSLDGGHVGFGVSNYVDGYGYGPSYGYGYGYGSPCKKYWKMYKITGKYKYKKKFKKCMAYYY